jgi:hypothetical protein
VLDVQNTSLMIYCCRSGHMSDLSFLFILRVLAVQILEISEFTMDQVSGDEDELRTIESVDVLFENMELMADYSVGIRSDIQRKKRDLQESSSTRPHVIPPSPTKKQVY